MAKSRTSGVDDSYSKFRNGSVWRLKLDSNNEDNRIDAVGQNNIPKRFYDKILNDKSPSVITTFLSYTPKISESQWLKLIRHKDMGVRLSADAYYKEFSNKHKSLVSKNVDWNQSEKYGWGED